MKYLIVTDEQLYSQLISAGYKLLNTRKSLNQNKVYTFEIDETKPLCFDISDASVRQKCMLTNKLTMTF